MTDTPKILALRAYTKAGYNLIPLRGKKPYTEGWREIKPGTYGEKELGTPGQNYGVALGDTDLILDVDPRNFVLDDRPLKRLIAAVGSSLASFTVQSGGEKAGVHVYLRKPAGALVVGSLAEYPGIDFLTVGRQVVGPGSIHPDSGKEYRVAAGAPDKVMEAPAALLEILKRTGVPYSELDGKAGTGEYKNDAGTQGRFISYLQDTVATSGSFKIACVGRDLGLPPQIVWELMLEYWNPRRPSPKTREDLKAKVIHAYKYATRAVGNSHPAADFSGDPLPSIPPKEEKRVAVKPTELVWVLNKAQEPVPSFQNLLNYLSLASVGLRNVFGLNEFTGMSEFVNPAPWHPHRKIPAYAAVTDHDLKMLKAYLTTEHAFEMPVTALEEAVAVTAHNNRFHPVRDYLNSLEWDGKRRIDFWLQEFLGVEDSTYTRAVGRKTLCAAVMRVMCPGCKFDHVLVLEGDQDIGKSSVCRILAGPFGGDFPIDPNNKDTIQYMQGKWIVELAELEVNKRAERDALKAFLSRDKDRIRMAYGRLPVELPRQSIFIGTFNPGADGTYLGDETGNRRWWPVACAPRGGVVNFAALKAARNQLWAEAVHVVREQKERLDMDTLELKNEARSVVALRHAEHPWTERIVQWSLGLAPDREFVSTREVFTDALGGIDKQFDRRAQLAIAGVLKKAGWRAGTKWIPFGVLGQGTAGRGYWRLGCGPAVYVGGHDDLADLKGLL